MAEPAASVILPAFLSHETIAACLRSLRRQTFGGFETILVDSYPDEAIARFVAAESLRCGCLGARTAPAPTPHATSAAGRRATALGIELWFEREARVLHDHRRGWYSFLSKRRQRGLDLGLERPRLEGWGATRTLAYALAAPVLTAWMLAQRARYVQAPAQWLAWLQCLPVLLAGYAARQCGQTRGYLKALWRA